MKITIKKINLQYFKGVKDLTLEFKDGNNLVLGQNGAGKSTIFDAFTWVLFGKSASGESDAKFGIKTTDANNNIIDKVEHSVTLWLDVDGEEHIIQRVLREKWVKKRGSLDTEFSGNVTDYFYNEVPKKKSEFDQKISQLISEDIFKVITNPLEFPNRHWEVQRSLLVSIIGDINDNDIAAGNDKFEALMSKLSNKDLEEYKLELSSKRKKLNEAIKHIPSKIAEVNHGKPDTLDYDAITKEKNKVEELIAEVDNQISDRNKAIEKQSEKRQNTSTEIFTLKNANQDIQLSVKKGLQEGNDDTELKDLERSFNNKVSDGANAETGLNRFKKDLEIVQNDLKNVSVKVLQLRKDWEASNALTFKFDPNSVDCPTCGRVLETENIEKEKIRLENIFKTGKAEELKHINDSGVLLAAKEKELNESVTKLEGRINDGKKFIENNQKEVDSLKEKIESLKSNSKEVIDLETALQQALSKHKTYQENLAKIQELQTSLDGDTGFDVSDLKAKRNELQEQISVFDKQLETKNLIKKADERIQELSADESKYAQQIADLEREEFLAQEFTIAKITSLESKVNALFNGISFKLFEKQVNGSEVPTCKLIYKGVEFNSLNTAAKTNSGLKVVAVLSDYYKVYAPIFIDARESITDLEPIQSQVISLVVSPTNKTLIVK